MLFHAIIHTSDWNVVAWHTYTRLKFCDITYMLTWDWNFATWHYTQMTLKFHYLTYLHETEIFIQSVRLTWHWNLLCVIILTWDWCFFTWHCTNLRLKFCYMTWCFCCLQDVERLWLSSSYINGDIKYVLEGLLCGVYFEKHKNICDLYFLSFDNPEMMQVV